MNEDIHLEMRASFRAEELQRRHARWNRLIAQLTNELILVDEIVPIESREACRRALQRLQAASRQLDRDIHGGYWKRLLSALLGL